MKKILLSLTITVGLVACAVAHAATQVDVVINEIAWMGSTNSANDEWMELKNATNNDINLSGWTLTSADGKLKIHLKGFIIANGFYLMERTSDDTVPGVPADMLYTGALNNTGQNLTLYDSSSNVIDQVNFSTKWPAGNNATKQTMEKTGSTWQTSKDPNGTPKAKNSTGALEVISPPPADTTKEGAINPTPTEDTKTYPSGVIINEMLPAPSGADDTNEWIELRNTNAVAIDMSGWKLQDIQGTVATYVFLDNTSIAANGYLVLKRPETKIMLNNDGDGVNLIFPNGKIADSISFANVLLNQSYSKTRLADWRWSTTPTPGSVNIITIPAVKTPSTKTKTTAKQSLLNTKKTDTSNNDSTINTASVIDAITPASDKPSGKTNPWFLFLIVFATIILFAVVILLVKLKIFKKGKELEV